MLRAMEMVIGHPIKKIVADEDAVYRFWRKVEVQKNGCWKWTGYLTEKGYGMFGFKYGSCKPGIAHRFAYETFTGKELPPRPLMLDHQCNNKWCVNPFHLAANTSWHNTIRANTPAGINHRKTHCIRGHEFTPENTTIIKRSKWRKHPSRMCRTCNRMRGRVLRGWKGDDMLKPTYSRPYGRSSPGKTRSLS